MVEKTLKVASRASRLAQAQTREALQALDAAYPGAFSFKIISATTPGDRDLETPLTDAAIPDDFFTRDLDVLLRKGKADLAVHSAKDLPKDIPAGLVVAAVLPALDIRDALVLRKGFRTTDKIRVIGTSSPRRENEIRKLFPGAEARPVRGAIDQRLKALDDGKYDAIIVAACALTRLGLASRIHHHLSYDPAPQQGRLAVTCRSDNQKLIDLLRPLDVRRKAGLVAIVGCPAEARLLSGRALQYLKQADIIFHDRLVPDDVLLAIREKAHAVGKAGGHASTTQSDIHRQMLHAAEQGRLVVRLHGGDPGIYGHLGEELEFLNAWNIRCDVVPAVTAMQVAAAVARAPLTHRGEGHRVTLVTARPSPGVEIENLPGPDLGNLAIYMGVSERKSVDAKLRAAGWTSDTPVIIGERLGYRDERIRPATLGTWQKLDVESPAVFLVGPKSYFTGDATLFVGTDPEHFLKHGPLIHFPLIKLVSRPLKDRVQLLKQHLADVRGILFPSRFAVHSLAEALLDWKDVRALAGKTLLAVGPATEEELKKYGLRAEGAADNLGGVHALAKKLNADFSGRYLYPCSDASPQRDRMATLKKHGIDLVPAVFYSNREMPYAALPRLPFSRVLFTSTTTVKAYFKRYPKERKADRTWLAVGPSTWKALQDLKLAADTIAD